jgi:hypothetical protein
MEAHRRTGMDPGGTHPQKAPGRIQVPTKFTPLSDSLETLLNGGAEIVAGSAGIGLTLRKGDKWIMCGLDDGRMRARPYATRSP